jgi:MoCo/4Fe-4S cofactor protein with predicted Tat translocation signal
MNSGKKFWRSLQEYQRSDAFGDMLKAEFPSLFELWTVDRREVLRVMGASLALAGICGCKPVRSDDVVPFVNRPEGYLEGRTDHYATAVLFDGFAQPVLATTSAGRPIKLDGNPEHPAFRGGSTPFMQAAILDLYDPDRSQAPLMGGHPASWADFDGQMVRLRDAWRTSEGAGLRLLIGPTSSPTMLRQIGGLRKALPQAQVHLFDPLSGYDGETPPAFTPDLREAVVAVSLDDDLLGPGPLQAVHARAWSERRGSAPAGERIRLWMAEVSPTQTGARADRRLGIPPSRLPALAEAIAARLGVAGATVTLTADELSWANEAAAALGRARGQSLLTAGRNAPPQVHALATAVNRALGNIGRTSNPASAPLFTAGPGQSFLDLVRDIEARRVSALFIIGGNPVYQAPGDIPFAAIYAKVPLRIHAGLHVDETAQVSNWHLPLPHLLEDWSDACSPDGLATLIQPVVHPLYDSRSAHELIATLTLDETPSARDLVRETWATQLGSAAAWTGALKSGFFTPAGAEGSQAPAAPATAAALSKPASADEVEIVIRPDPTIHDGSFANNGWLQELPKPLFKTTWENVVAISPQLAAAIKVDSGDMLRVASDGREIEGPAWVLPGQPDRVVTLYLGYGRKRGGRIGPGLGYDAYRLRGRADPWTASGTVKPSGSKVRLATTQQQHLMDGEVDGLVRTVTPEHPSALRADEQDHSSFYPDWPEEKPAWGMVIDLDKCIGCNACVVACQAENNIPVVGKEQVALGREMHWLRVDRYYAGEPEDPETHFQPVPCMHCEQAPCEMGCPVHATVHSPEGVNLMVYNRCIGTRTCSSYCPYKVRRFNWFDYTTDAPSPTEAQRNPDVTVRGRGVMEKCTYCIQRIEGATVRADIENRAVREGEVTTACQQACPAQAISFGNLADKQGETAKQRSDPRNYSLLGEQGTRPRTTYLARIAGEDGDGD